MASVECELIPGVWGESPQLGPGQSPGQESHTHLLYLAARRLDQRSPPEAERKLNFNNTITR